MKLIPFRLVSLIILTTFFINSCRKHAPKCAGNCAEINVSGKVINKLTNENAGNVPVTLCWSKFVGIASQSLDITTVKSNYDGSFNFNSNIDTAYFRNGYYLSLIVNSNRQFIILGYSGNISERIYSFDPNAFQNVQFEVFRKANLTLKLHRVQNDIFNAFSIKTSVVVDNFYLTQYSVRSPQEVVARNTYEIDVSTVADVFTRIRLTKSFSNGTSTTTIDSIRCTTTSPNVYHVYF
jgi:hypothetical protein